MVIKLRRDTFFSTGYLGRGVVRQGMWLKAGHTVNYTKTVTQAGIYHVAWINALAQIHGRKTWCRYEATVIQSAKPLQETLFH